MEKIAPITIIVPSATIFASLLAIACWTDIRDRRISNKLVLFGMFVAILLHSFIPPGSGLFNSSPGGLGYLSALGGFATGLGILMPFYLLRTMGAGDVKLMAMVGAFIGPSSVLGATLMTLLAGGILAILAALWNGALTKALRNSQSMITSSFLNAISGHWTPISGNATLSIKLPYAIAITSGTAIHVLLQNSGYAIFL